MASHSFRFSPGGSFTASDKSPDPSVSLANWCKSCCVEPLVNLCLGRNVLFLSSSPENMMMMVIQKKSDCCLFGAFF
ncbi:hypothetical protein D3C80_1974050 [compost metagenome]